MPTILQVNGFRFFFFSADGNEPCHIHVKKGDGDGKIWLEPEVRVEYLIASEKELQDYNISRTGIHWPSLDEDLSLRGFLREEMLKYLKSSATTVA